MSISSKEENLIFLISQPRAGSTMLQLMLANIPDIVTNSETWIALHPIFGLKKRGIETIYQASLAEVALNEFLGFIGETTEFYKKQVKCFLNEFYSEATRKHGGKYFLDKTPRYYHIIDDLLELFPDQKFIILFRNPLSVLNSILETWVKSDLSMLSYYFEDLFVAPGKMVQALEKHSERCIKLNYENIVNNPMKNMHDICRYLGIEFSEKYIEYEYISSWKYGDQVGVKKYIRPNTDCIERWKTGFKTQEKRSLAVSYLKCLGSELLKKMGYQYNELFETINESATKGVDIKLPIKNIYDVVDTITHDLDIKRVVFKLMASKTDKTKNKIITNSEIEKLVNYYISPKIEQLNKEIEIERVKVGRAVAEIDRMQKTLSWRMTKPIRKFKKLESIVKKLKNAK